MDGIPEAMDPNDGFAVVKRPPMIFRTLIALVVLAPLPFASVPAWSWSLSLGLGTDLSFTTPRGGGQAPSSPA